ncbi:MAG: biopolymer transporter ExbD [Pseudomonadota bacterium]
MITRPLDLASKLRPEPRNFDFVFLLNGGLIVLFFYLFGSRFVLAPGLGVDFQLPQVSRSALGTALTTHHISIKRGGMLFAADQGGQITLPRLRDWLNDQAKVTKRPVLLIRADAGVEMSVLADVFTAAREAGFEAVLAADPIHVLPDGPN